MPRRNVLVTGASGFIGGHLVSRLLSDGCQVSILVRPESVVPERWNKKVIVVSCEDWSETGLTHALANSSCDTVFHLAAYGVRPTHRDPDGMMSINIGMAATLVRLCHKWGARLVISGTFSEYRKPDANERLTELSPLEPFKLYGASKAAGGLLASALAQNLGVGLRNLRLFKVYGAGEADHRLLPALVHGLRQRQKVQMSSGTQILDFVYIDDVIEALLRSDRNIEDRGDAATWNVATGCAHSVRDFAETVAKAMNVDRTLLAFGEIEMRKDDEPWLVGDPLLMQSQLDWHPRTGLEAGIRASLAAMSGNI